MTGETVQLMILPAAGDSLPQVLLDDGGIWRDTLQPQVGVPSPRALRQAIEKHLGPLMLQVGGTPPVAVRADSAGFSNPFSAWYQNLLPTEVRDVLKAVADGAGPGAPPLLKIFLTPGAEWIPWELLYDGTGFLGLRFAVCRLPIVRQRTEVRGSKQRDVRSVFSLLAKDILKDGGLAAWETTFTPYAPAATWEHRYPATNGGSVYPTLDQISEAKQADILHLTCHGGMRDAENDDLYWTLDHTNPRTFDYRITADFAAVAMLAKRPLVFGNACASIATKAGDRGALHGFGASFMIGGALNFVGTFAPITNDTAITFARRFYERLFGSGGTAGLPVGEALLATKQSFFKAGHPDPSYLFYCLYGPPDTTYKPS